MPDPVLAPHFLRTRGGRALIYQALALCALVAAGWFLWHNTAENLAARQIRSGFAFMRQPAGFDIGETLFAYSSRDTYLRAFAIGVANTLRVALLGIVLATVLGTLVGIGRLSRNLLARGLCTAYVEVMRNIPLIIQLFAWYLVITELLPAATEPLRIGPYVFLSKSGLQFPFPDLSGGWPLAVPEVGEGKGWGLGKGIDFEATPTLADVIAGTVPGRQTDQEVTCFINNLGLGFQFAAAAAVVYRKAKESGVGRDLPTEWFTQDVHP